MRTLPDHPSLDHLRRQAKDQLEALRTADPDATLTDAQATLARQYGFDTWAELKREAERRSAQAARAADTDLSRCIAQAFGLGAPVTAMTHVERDWAGEVWDLRTTDGRWVVTALADYVSAEAADVRGMLVAAAIGAGVLAPRPVPTTVGGFVLDDGSHRWRVDEWMSMGAPLPQPPTAAAAAEGGRILARLHNLDLTPPGPVVPWLTHRPSEASWRGIAESARDEGRSWAAALEGAIPGFLALDTVVDTGDPNPRAVLSKAWHAPAAARPAGSDGLVVTGWDHAGSTPKDWELGSALMAWAETVDNDYDPATARVFLDGYRELAPDIPVTPAIFTSGVAAQLNWTISRANIALHDDDPTRRAEADRNIRSLARNPICPDAVHRLAEVCGRGS